MKRENAVKWRNRYAGASEELTKTEAETPRKLGSVIEKVLSDAPRAGAPCTFTDEQVACIIALACELPESLELPFSHWSPSLLRKEVDVLPTPKGGGFHWLLWGNPPPPCLKAGASAAVVTW